MDDTLQHGEIVAPSASGNVPGTRAINDLVAGDDRVTSVLLPFADGLTLIRKASIRKAPIQVEWLVVACGSRDNRGIPQVDQGGSRWCRVCDGSSPPPRSRY